MTIRRIGECARAQKKGELERLIDLDTFIRMARNENWKPRVFERLRTIVTTTAAVATGAAHTIMHGDEPTVTLKPGDPAPEFALAGSDGRTYRLRDLRGRPVVLAWFPKAFTGG